MKKYDSHRLGESQQSQALLHGANANSPLLPGSARHPMGHNGNLQQRNSTNTLINNVSPAMGPLAGLSGLLALGPGQMGAGINGSGPRERSHSRRLTAEGQSLTDVSF